MLKKSIAIMLCVLMVLGLTACTTTTTEGGGSYYEVESYIVTGGSNSEKSDTADNDADTTVSSKKKKTSSSSSKASTASVDSNTAKETGGRFDVDLSGKTVKVLVWYTPEDWEQKIYDQFEAQTGAKFKFVYTGSSTVQQKLTALIAANDAPDVAIFGSSDFPSFITKKLAQPLTDYISDEDTWLAYDLMDAMSYNGEYYGVTDHFWGGATFVYYNKKIFDSSTKVKNTPLELYEQGKWNWDTFYELCEALTVKDKQGNVTQWGAYSQGIDNFIRSAGGAVVSYKNGKVTNTINSAELKNACSFVQKLVKNDYYTTTQGSWKDGNVAMYLFSEYPVRTESYESWSGLSFDWDWVPFPEYTDGTAYQPVGIQIGSVPRKAKNPEAGYLLVCWRAYYQENMKTLTQSNKKWIDRYKKAVTESKTAYALDVGIVGSEIWTIYGALNNPINSIKSTVDSYSSVIDGKIKDYEEEAANFKF